MPSKHPKGSFTCDECSKTYKRKDVLIRHIKTHDPNSSYECFYCQKQFNRKENLIYHIFNRSNHLYIRPVNNDKTKFQCEHCGFRSSENKILIRHLKNIHSDKCCELLPKKLVCPLCKQKTSSSKQHLEHHLRNAHNENVVREFISFNSREQFNVWKNEIEKSAYCRFIIKSTRKRRSSINVHYVCHRTGFYKSGSCKNIRRQKYQGSKKMNAHCPAEIKLRVNTDNNLEGSCTVEYVKTHLGHDIMDLKELSHVFTTRTRHVPSTGITETGMLESIVTAEQTELDKTQSENLDIDDTQNEQYLLTDPVFAFIHDMGNSVLYFKPRGMVSGDEVDRFLEEEDFILIIMTDLQKMMLRKNTCDTVAVDISPSTEENKILLHALLVTDDYREGFPAAFVVSNRNDVELIGIFLRCLKKEIGTLHVGTLLTDVQGTVISSWCSVMDHPQQYCFCAWLVNEEWRKYCQLISDKEERKKVKEELNELSSFIPKDVFREKLESFVNNSDERRAAFLKNFKSNFLNDCHLWAYGYRDYHSRVNPNMYLTVSYKNLKSKFAKGLKIEELTKGLACLKNYLQGLTDETVLREIKGKRTNKLRQLRQRHDYVESAMIAGELDGDITKYSENQWLISLVETELRNGRLIEEHSSGDTVLESKMYFLEKVQDTCPDCKLFCEKCQICFHEFICHCPDAAIKNNMCKHIHALGILSSRITSANFAANTETQFAFPCDQREDVSVEDDCINDVRRTSWLQEENDDGLTTFDDEYTTTEETLLNTVLNEHPFINSVSSHSSVKMDDSEEVADDLKTKFFGILNSVHDTKKLNVARKQLELMKSTLKD